MSAAQILRGIRAAVAAAAATDVGGDFTEASMADVDAANQWMRAIREERPATIIVLSAAELHELRNALGNTIDDGTFRDEWVKGSARRRAFDSMLKKLEIKR